MHQASTGCGGGAHGDNHGLYVDGKPISVLGGVVLPGRHVVTVGAWWSNSSRSKDIEKTQLTLDAQPGKKYVALIYELERGQDPATAEIREKTFGEQVIRFGWGDALGPLMLFAVLFVLNKPAPISRPYNDCCFVWIQDAETGEVVAGTSPRTASTKKSQ